MLILYDRILGDYINKKSIRTVIYTGLSQIPYTQNKFYYRLKNHTKFLDDLGLNYSSVNCRMTRDFEITFDKNDARDLCYQALISLRIKGSDFIFKEIEIREKSLFVTLTFPNELNDEHLLEYEDKCFKFKNYVNFVAVKNGMHHQKGFLFYPKTKGLDIPNDINIKDLKSCLMPFFKAYNY